MKRVTTKKVFVPPREELNLSKLDEKEVRLARFIHDVRWGGTGYLNRSREQLPKEDSSQDFRSNQRT